MSYVGTIGTHLMRPININAPEAGVVGAAPGNRVNAVRPYLGYGSISYRESSGASNYHSLQVSFKRSLSRKATFGLAYTWGKSIDDGSSERADGDLPPNKHNVRAERATSDFDRSHILTSNFIYYVPRGARGPLNNVFFRQILDGWQSSGIVRMWSGQPIDITMNYDVAGLGATQNQRPNVIADPHGPRTTEEWFNRSAFARPANGTFGSLGRNVLHGPGVHKWDLAMLKNFRVAERGNLQFRAEMFNAFNHPSFSTMGRTLTTTAAGVNPAAGNFGIITDTRDARVVQFALKLTF